MSAADGTVLGTTKIVDHRADAARWNLVILGDGFQNVELPAYATAAMAFVNALQAAAPFPTLWPAINVHRVDVASTESGAADPVACGGTGAAPKTYFDASFCTGGLSRALGVTNATALDVATAAVPNVHMTVVIVNSLKYGGSGGGIAVFSLDPSANEIAIHEMGHTAFGFADEYEYWAGCATHETGHDAYTGAEPTEPNVTANGDRATAKWAALIADATPIPTTLNADRSTCDPQSSPVGADTVGLFEGARYFHGAAFRPQFTCRMRALGHPFCAVCADVITTKLTPFLPAVNPLPSIMAIAPTSGSAMGGDTVIISGSGFTGATSVAFGFSDAPMFTIDSDTQITVTSPPGNGAVVDVTVTASAGPSVSSTGDQFTYAQT